VAVIRAQFITSKNYGYCQQKRLDVWYKAVRRLTREHPLMRATVVLHRTVLLRYVNELAGPPSQAEIAVTNSDHDKTLRKFRRERAVVAYSIQRSKG